MISTIFNELSVQVVSDFFPKPKQFSNLIRCHQCQSPCTNQFQAFRSFLFSDFNHRAQNKSKFNRHFCSFLFTQACLQANTNTNLTGILSPPFYPSLPSSKHKYKFNRHFVPSFLSKPAFKQTQIQIQQAFCFFLFIQACLQANTKQITITVNTEQIKAKQIKTNTRQEHP